MNRHEDNENEVERASKKIFRDFEFIGIKDEYFDETEFIHSSNRKDANKVNNEVKDDKGSSSN